MVVPHTPGRKSPSASALLVGAAVMVAVLVVAAVVVAVHLSNVNHVQALTPAQAAAQPLPEPSAEAASQVDPGTNLQGRPAPDFSLTDQHNRPVSLASYRGHPVVLAFLDPVCTTICPLTTVSMVQAVSLLGQSAAGVRLLGIDANPQVTSTAALRGYTAAHEMPASWDFLTGSPAALAGVWHAYGVYVAANAGNIDHDPAVFVLDGQGRERWLYLSQLAYASIGQQAAALANGLAQVLRSGFHSSLTADPAAVTPAMTTTLQRAAGVSDTVPAGNVVLGPKQPHLLFFFASWLSEVGGLSSDLHDLNRYALLARQHHWPAPVAVDETAVEPDPTALAQTLAALHTTLDFPVVLDPTGQVADGYQVQSMPTYMLIETAGKVAFTNQGDFAYNNLVAAVSKAVAAVATP